MLSCGLYSVSSPYSCFTDTSSSYIYFNLKKIAIYNYNISRKNLTLQSEKLPLPSFLQSFHDVVGLILVGFHAVIQVEHEEDLWLLLVDFLHWEELNGHFYRFFRLSEVIQCARQVTGDCLGPTVVDLWARLSSAYYFSFIEDLECQSIMISLNVSSRHIQINRQQHRIPHVMVPRVFHVLSIVKNHILIVEHR